MDPLVRVYLRQSAAASSPTTPPQLFDSELRIGTRDPVWDFKCRLLAVPSTQCELGIQVIDEKRNEAAGEVCVSLRSLLDQREHDEWLVLPPTLRQQVLEKTPRSVAARLHVKLTFSHTKVGSAGETTGVAWSGTLTCVFSPPCRSRLCSRESSRACSRPATRSSRRSASTSSKSSTRCFTSYPSIPLPPSNEKNRLTTI